MSSARPTICPQQILKRSALRVAWAAVLVTTCTLGTLGIATPQASTVLAATSAAATLTFTPASLSFGSVGLGSSRTLPVAIKNTGSASAYISAASVSGSEFSITGLTVPTTLAAGASLTVTAKFAPTASGAVTGTFNITSNATNSIVKFALSGTGVTPALTATPSSVLFGSVPLGTTKSETIALKNSSSQSVVITGMSASLKQFHASGLTLPLTLAAGATTHFNLSFTPASTGLLEGSLITSIASWTGGATSSPSVPLVLAISGTGVLATRTITATPTSLDFGSATVGKSNLLTVSLKNTGNSSVTVSGISVSDVDFTTSGSVTGVTLAAGQSVVLNVIYAPKTASKQSGTVKVSSNATNSPATIAVTGTGVSTSVHSVELTWDASSSTGVIGYYVYRSTAPASGFARLVASPLSGVQYTDGTVQSGITYYYEVTAVNSVGQESGATPAVMAVVP